MTTELPMDILEKDSEEIKSILTERDSSDFMWGLTNLFTNLMKSLGFVPPEYQAATDIVNYIKENFGSTVAQRRQLEFLTLLFKRLKELEQKIDKDFIKKEEFEIYIQRFLDEIKHQQYKEKLLAFRNALVNIATNSVSNNFEIEYFINSLISFSDLHFALLSYFNLPEEKLKEKGIDVNGLKSQSGGEEEILKSLFDNIDFELAKIASKELKDKGYATTQLPFGGGLTTYSTYQRLTNDYLTPLGKKFISFCLDNN